MFGDIVKVTPSSKVVGDMALLMVSQGLSAEDVLDPKRDVAFPASVVEMLRGDLGQPVNGWPKELQKKALKGAKPITVRPGSLLKPADFAAVRAEAEKKAQRALSDQELAALSDVSQGVHRLRHRRAEIWPGGRAADACVLLRHADRR